MFVFKAFRGIVFVAGIVALSGCIVGGGSHHRDRDNHSARHHFGPPSSSHSASQHLGPPPAR